MKPQQIAAVGEADLVVYMAQYQAAFDEAVAQQHPNQALDVGDFLELRHATKEGDDERENEGSPGHDHGVVDPHVWLNPLNMAEMGRRIHDIPLARQLADHVIVMQKGRIVEQGRDVWEHPVYPYTKAYFKAQL